MTFTFMSFESLCYRLDALEMQLQHVGSILVALTALTRLANTLGTEEQDICPVDLLPLFLIIRIKLGRVTEQTVLPTFAMNRIREFNFMVNIIAIIDSSGTR